ALLSEKF
ncbi:hypothetical protein D047_4121B, partial [Vibrio parahaemolyticus VPTS-2010_2]